MRRRATPRANFIPRIPTQLILLLDARMIAGRVTLGLPSLSQLRCFACLHCVPESSGYALACYNDAATALDFDVQVVPIEQQHPDERGAAHCVGLDVPRSAVPKHSDVVNVEIHLSVVGQKSLAHVSEG